MVKNIGAILTLVRNKLNYDTSWEEKILYFNSKGIDLSIFGELYFIKSNAMTSEFSVVPPGIVFRGSEVECYHGQPVQKKKYSETKEGIFVWNDNTVLFDIIAGKKAYLYHDSVDGWVCADDKKPQSTLSSLIVDKIYNIEALDPRYTYEFILCEKGDNAGLYLIAVYDNKKYFEIDWKEADMIALRHKLLRPSAYKTKELEASDLPIIAQDQCMTKFEIYEI